MGYRSDVAIVIYGDTDDVTAFVAGEKLKDRPKGTEYHPMEEDIHEGYHEREMYPINDGKETVLEWNWWSTKWYDSYPETVYWENLASVWHDAFKNTSLCMEIARVGENSDDLETNYYGENCQYYLTVSRAIEKSMPHNSNLEVDDIKQREAVSVDEVRLALGKPIDKSKSKMANGDQHEKGEWGQEADTTFPYGKRRTK